eukprot:488213-Pyramimonas_sp.AAC.2
MAAVAEIDNNAGAPARSAPPSVPVNDTRLRSMERATDRSAQWLQSPHTYMPYGRDPRPRNQRRTESPVSVRSGNSGISERDMLRTVCMVNTDGQMGMRADEDTFLNLPTTSASCRFTYDEYPSAWAFERNPIAEEEARGCINVFASLSRNDWVLDQGRRKGMHGTAVSEVPGLFGERHLLALAANS